MGNVFNSTPVRKPNRSRFDLSHDVKFSCDFAKLTPILLQEVLPGDVFNIQTQTLIRFAPLIAPVMHNIRVFTHYFFIPNRILFDNWDDFISPDLSKTTPPSWPYLSILRNNTLTTNGTLWDYLGLPTGSAGLPAGDRFPEVSALPFSAYQAVFNEYYRDQNMVAEVDYKLSGGNMSPKWNTIGTLRTRAWQHDYFTAALPFAQKGPAVDLPINQSQSELTVYRDVASGSGTTDWDSIGKGLVSVEDKESRSPVHSNDLFVDTADMHIAATTINDLRVAFRLQEFFEKAARGGTRYIEQLKVHFNVQSSDQRLNRPEFLGGTVNPVIISEVLQTSSSDETTPQGTMAGHGISAGSGKRIRYYAEEHGYIIGIQSIMPSTAYQQGIPRHFSRTSWEEYAWPTFAHLGEQAILNKELFVANDGQNDDTFGFIPRYSEYRYAPSRVAGEFRSSLAFWHLGRIFANRPQLNSDFIVPRPNDTNRIFAAQAVPQKLWCHSFHNVNVKRALPKYGSPTL